MSEPIVGQTRRIAEEAAIDAAWAQWTALMSLATPTGDRRPWTIIDPEALILVSLAFGAREARLRDLVAAWAGAGSFLISKPRFKSIGALFPPDVEARVGDFARYAAEAGDTSWRRLATSAETGRSAPREKKPGPLRPVEGPSLVLRLRAGFGVNAKADILALLPGLDGVAADLNTLRAATGYSDPAVPTATAEMVLAGLIREIQGRPSSFWVDPEPWAGVLRSYRLEAQGDAPSIPPWHYWSVLFPFLTAVDRWGRKAVEEEWTDYVASSRARDLYETHERQLVRAGIESIPPGAGRGSEFLGAFGAIVSAVRDWIAANT
ncbi:MAG: hypothetical protein ACN0LA_08745 [Candidatus Longimicrobiales bacterium M2_2A_002]